jgi:hypothetical protein
MRILQGSICRSYKIYDRSTISRVLLKGLESLVLPRHLEIGSLKFAGG